MADNELERRNSMAEKIEYISRQLAQLEIVKDLPDVDVNSDHLVNRAMDVLSASLMYMAIQIRHEAGYFGVPGELYSPILGLQVVGSIISVAVKGKDKLDPTEQTLKKAIDGFYNALSHFGHHVSFKSFDEIRGKFNGRCH
jgi:hypothetical protein